MEERCVRAIKAQDSGPSSDWPPLGRLGLAKRAVSLGIAGILPRRGVDLGLRPVVSDHG